MGVADNKRGIFSTIGAYTSMGQNDTPPSFRDSFKSVNDKNDPINFQIEVLKSIAGTEPLKEMTGELLTSALDETEPKIKSTLKSQFTQSNAEAELPNDFRNAGIRIPIKNLDGNGKLRVSPSSPAGSVMYDTSTPSVDNTIRTVIESEGNPATFGNVSMVYDSSDDVIIVKPILGQGISTVGAFFISFIDNTTFLKKKELVAEVLDTIFGTTSNEMGRSSKNVADDLMVKKMLENVLSGDDSFIVPFGELDEILRRSEEIVRGVNYIDVGCDRIEASLSLDDIADLQDVILNSTDPTEIGNAIAETLRLSNQSLAAQDNEESIRDNFITRIINILILGVLEACITSPTARLLQAILSAFQGVEIGSIKDDLEKFKTMIKCMSKEIKMAIAAYIFFFVLKYLRELMKPIVKKVVKEKITNMKRQLKSLTMGDIV